MTLPAEPCNNLASKSINHGRLKKLHPSDPLHDSLTRNFFVLRMQILKGFCKQFCSALVSQPSLSQGPDLKIRSEGFISAVTVYERFQSWHVIVMGYTCKSCKFWKFTLVIIMHVWISPSPGIVAPVYCLYFKWPLCPKCLCKSPASQDCHLKFQNWSWNQSFKRGQSGERLYFLYLSFM